MLVVTGACQYHGGNTQICRRNLSDAIRPHPVAMPRLLRCYGTAIDGKQDGLFHSCRRIPCPRSDPRHGTGRRRPRKFFGPRAARHSTPTLVLQPASTDRRRSDSPKNTAIDATLCNPAGQHNQKDGVQNEKTTKNQRRIFSTTPAWCICVVRYMVFSWCRVCGSLR